MTFRFALKILTRYVLFDLLQVFLLTLAGLTAFIFIALIGKEAIDKGLGLGPLVRMAPYLLPQAMQFAVPGTMLLATTNVFGKLSAFNEVVAMKSMGITPWAVAWPTFLLAGSVSFVAVFLNDVAVSWGRMGVEQVFVDSLEEVVYGQLRVHRSFANDSFQINVQRVEGRKLIRPTVTVYSSPGKAKEDKKSNDPWTISAKWAELESLPDSGQLVIRFNDLDLDGPVKYTDPSTFTHVMSLDDLAGGGGNRSPSTYALAEIGSATKRQKTELAALRDDMTAQAALAMMTGELEQLSETAWQPLTEQVGGAEYTLTRLGTEPYRRWANGFSCLGFVMVGVPVSILMRKGEFLSSFFMCFAPILILYYPLLMVSLDKAKGGSIPPASVWIGNLVLAVVGLWLMKRVVRY